MISIITSIYNQRSMNELFYNSLIENTYNPFELIVVDNKSTDGSAEYFSTKKNVVLIQNGGNYNYPYCQNKGLEQAQYEHVCFFNNDIIVSPNWDIRIIKILKENDSLKILSVATNDHLQSKAVQKSISRKWKRIKYPLQSILGNSKFSLNLMILLMYGNFNKFAEERFLKWGYRLIEGYSGSSIISTKSYILSIGRWDERIQAADYDLFNRMKTISEEEERVLPIQLALGVYFHHFQRLTVKKKFPPFENKSTMMSLSEKWGEKTNDLRKDIEG